jgi:SAM-dependent methyltransferase
MVKDEAFSGGKGQGNPYLGAIKDALPQEEVNTHALQRYDSTNDTTVLSLYRYGARHAAQFLPQPETGETILEIGSGTGDSTLELFLKYPGVDFNILGIEQSQGMLAVAQYKFHHEDGENVMAAEPNEQVQSFWNAFRQESESYQGRVQFVNDDFLTTTSLDKEAYKSAVAIQVMHWLDSGEKGKDLTSALSRFSEFIKPEGSLLWTTSSHYFNDKKFPTLEYNCRYNDFFKFVLEEVSHSYAVNGVEQLPQPKQNLESVQAASRAAGMETTQLTTRMNEFDLQTLVSFHTPRIVRSLLKEPDNVDDSELQKVTKAAVQKAIGNIYDGTLSDTKHIHDIVPVFMSVKK